jgi:peroxiredoxin
MKAKVLSIALASVAAAALLAVGVTANGQTVGAIAAAAQVKVAEKAEDFRLVDQNSKTQLLSYYKNSPAIVIIAQQNGAQAIHDAAAEIKALQASFAGKEIALLMLNSTPADNRDTIAAEMASLGLDLPVMIDDTQLVGESLGVSRVAQAIVIQPKTWKVVYSGPICFRRQDLRGRRGDQPRRRNARESLDGRDQDAADRLPQPRSQGRVRAHFVRERHLADPRERTASPATPKAASRRSR